MTAPILDLTPLKNHSQGPWAWSVAERLKQAGFEVYLAGGCVRDLALGRVPHDLDLVTSALPEQIEKLFEKTVDVGRSFGVMRVLGEGQDLEVATYRVDGPYEDGRRPTSVVFATAPEDAQRRDFTINALFLDPWSGQVLDYVEGLRDLNSRLVRTVGEPERRFREDKLRLLRAVRFAAHLGFSLDPETWHGICEHASWAKTVSPERIREETGKMLRGNDPTEALRLLEASGLRQELFPELSAQAVALGTPLWESARSEEWRLWGLWLAQRMLNAGASSAEFLPFAKRWKFSRAEEQCLGDFLRQLEERSSWASLRLGERLQRMARPGIHWALRVLEFADPSEGQWAQDLRESETRGELPAPFVRGEDLRSRFQGPRLGDVLRETYMVQLEGAFNDRESALAWIDAQPAFRVQS